MAKRRKASGTNRTVIHLSDVNYISVHAALTPPGESKPQFGVMSQFFNELLDNWRVARAKEASNDRPNAGSE